MFKKLFGKSESKRAAVDNISAPLEGKLMSITEVPDPVFAQKMMGDGFAVHPTKGEVVSPVAGKVMSVFPSKHAIALESDNGREILIHFGLETVALNGEGFELLVDANQTVTQGQMLLKVDLPFVEKNAVSTITSVVFTNLKEGEKISLLKEQDVVLNESDIIAITK